jgi:MFS family permease
VGVGLASGYITAQYLLSVFAPHILADFGWSKAQFATVGVLPLMTVVAGPIAGRLTDIHGVRRVAAVGIVGTPLVFVALSRMTGDFRLFFWISALQLLFVGVTTTSIVYSRAIAEQFTGARGLALSIVGAAPAIVAAISAPLLSRFIDHHGWRAGYVALAIGTAFGGALALLILPKRRPPPPEIATVPGAGSGHRRLYAQLLRDRTIWIVIVGSFLCNIPYFMETSQLMVLLLDKGIDSATAALMVSAFALSVMGGRVVAGLALDRYPPHVVVPLALGIPVLGLIVLATDVRSPILIGASILMLGFSMGSEINISPFLAMHFFRADRWNAVTGMFAGALALSTAVGALLLSLTLKLTDHFEAFLLLSAIGTAVGSALFLLLRNSPVPAPLVSADL